MYRVYVDIQITCLITKKVIWFIFECL